jgi:Na+-transporting NADH:ubiquinone oxidoreductase subunit B
LKKEERVFTKQDPMRRVVYSLVPIFLWSVYLYGWRVVALTAFVYLLGITAEYVFEKQKNKKVSEAVLVTCGLVALSLPPAVPFWVAGVGILFAVIFGKEVYGGFGRNLFNPAITGRTFTYISFPLMMQTTWMFPGNFGLTHMNGQVAGSIGLEAVVMLALAGFVYWLFTKNSGKTPVVLWGTLGAVVFTVAFYVVLGYSGLQSSFREVDVVATATPLEIFKGLAQQNDWHQTVSFFGMNLGAMENNEWWNLLLGLRIGSIGEGAIFLIILAGLYLLWTKTANWRPMIMTLASALVLSAIFYFTGALTKNLPLLSPEGKDIGTQLLDICRFMMSGSLLFVAVFMATDPVSAPKKPVAQLLYGVMIGGITITIRAFSGFPEGVSFAILTANTFAALLDEVLPAKKKPAKKAAPAKDSAPKEAQA